MGRSKKGTLSQHTAVPAVTGYIYQLQLACLRLFDLQEGEQLGIEVLDDIHVERDGAALELSQAKHHRRRVSLSSRSEEFWKTLGIWARAITDGSLDITTIKQLVLMTRAVVSEKSIPAMIIRGENPQAVVDAFKAQGSFKSKKLQADYDAVMALPAQTLQTFVERLSVSANLPDLTGITEELKRRLRRHGFHERTIDEAVKRLYGWLWDMVTKCLDASHSNSPILISEAQFHAAQCRIRDELVDERLPVRYVDAKLSASDLLGQKQKVYVQQLDLIGASDNLKQRSISAYFRARSERNEWTEQGDVLPGELGRYDQELTERWSTEFDIMCEDVQRVGSEAELQQRCQHHFQAIERLELPIRPGWLYRYLTTGSYHMLADNKSVGWHPRYVQLLDAGDKTKDGKENQ